MLLRLVSPVRRSGSNNIQLQKRIPSDVQARLVGTRLSVPLGPSVVPVIVTEAMRTVRVSLQTADPIVAKARQAEAVAYLERVFQAARQDHPIELTRRHAVALSQAIYRAWVGGEGRERTIAMEQTPEGWRRVSGLEADGPELAEGFGSIVAKLDGINGADEETLETLLGPIVDAELLKLGLARVAPHSRGLVLEEFLRSLRDALAVRARNAVGDYRPDPNAERFPPLGVPHSDAERPPAPSPSSLPLETLVEDWWREQKVAGIAESTYVNYRSTVRKLVAFLGHDDGARVTAKDIVAFKDHRIQVVSARTVKDNDLAALRSVFGWGVANLKLPSNPAVGISVKLGKRKQGRPKGYTEAEAQAVLMASSSLQQGREQDKTYAAKRWVPWVLAYTGARVGEIVQMRQEDLVWEKDHWAVLITPDAGTVKGGKYRVVPLHPHLVELGFVAWVQQAPPGHLFVEPNDKTGDVLGPLKGAINRVTEFARAQVPQGPPLPNHAWRHRFITLCRAHAVSDELRDMITGHTGKTVAAREYGEVAGLYREVCKLPKIILGQLPNSAGRVAA